MRRIGACGACMVAATLAAGVRPAVAQDVGRAAVDRLRFPPLRFDPPRPEVHRLTPGVTVYFLEDHTLPLVDVVARFGGGYARFGREDYAAGTALPTLLRSGGTAGMSPDSVDHVLGALAVETAFGGSGEATFATLNTLSDQLGAALDLWGELLKRPRFDSSRVEIWRGRELEAVRRRGDDPGRLAFSEFNRLMFPNHPIGWELGDEDLKPEALSRERLLRLHRRLVCPQNLVLGVTGDVTWARMRPALQALLADWAPCSDTRPEAPSPEMRTEGGIFLIPRRLDQTTVVMAHATELRQEDSPTYFASRIGNSILGGGGLTSRLSSRLRTERGYAYAASSLWTAPAHYGGVVGATTRTKPGSTVAAIRLTLEVIGEMTREPPRPFEVATAVEQASNGFVFNFSSPAQIVSRWLAYQASGLPSDWLEHFLAGLQRVAPEDVLAVFRRYVDPARMTILVVGDPTAFDEPLDVLGPVTILEPEDRAPPSPSGAPRSRR